METMKYEVNREIPVTAETDVLVIGGGPGGIGAAVMAARQGVKTMLAERFGCPGGMAVFGEVDSENPGTVPYHRRPVLGMMN